VPAASADAGAGEAEGPSPGGPGGGPASPADLVPEPLRSDLVGLRRRLHAHPEISGQERETRETLRGFLEERGVSELREVAGTGLVARIPGRDPEVPAVAVRGDIDALPIREETGLPFASERPGVMHACGHDIHASWAVGAALLLAESPADGDALLVLQPAEETAEGARAVLEAGALEEAAAIFGAHVDTAFEVGKVVAQPGPLAASADRFDVTVRGRGGHAARPHQTRDPLAAAADLVGRLYALVPRRLGTDRAAVLSVGALHAGEAFNVIPGEARLRGTIRATDPETRKRVVAELERVTRATAEAHGVEAGVEVTPAVPALLNGEREAGWAREAAGRVLGPGAVVPLPGRNMAGEDFAFYLEEVPGAFLRIGAREPGEEPIGAHSPRFRPSEDALFVGAAVLAEAARTASRGLAGGGAAGGG